MLNDGTGISADAAQNEQLLAKIKRLEQDNQRLKKKAAASSSVQDRGEDDDDDGDPDKLPVESEEEQEYITESRKVATTFRSCGIYDADGKEPKKVKVLRRMEDPAARFPPPRSEARPPSAPTPTRSQVTSRPSSAPLPPPTSMIDPRLRRDELEGSANYMDEDRNADEFTTSTPPDSPHATSTTYLPPRTMATSTPHVRSPSPNDPSDYYRAHHREDHQPRDRSPDSPLARERSMSPPRQPASRYRSTDPVAPATTRSIPHEAASRASSAAPMPSRSRSRSSVPTQHSESESRSRSSRQSSKSPQPNVPPATTPPPFRSGIVPTGDAKASDYEPHATKLILAACRHFEALVLTENPFPDDAEQETWVKDAWKQACGVAKLSYTLPERIKKLIASRTSHAQGALKDCVRPMVATKYGFSSTTDEATKIANRALYERLLDLNNPEGSEPTFHYQDVVNLTGYGRNEIVSHAIRDQWFRNTDGIGLQLPTQFCPIREATLAIIFTAIEFCLDQWADGTLKSEGGRFTEKEYKPKYQAHLARIEQWTKLNPTVTEAIRKQMHDDARLASSVAPVLSAMPQLSATSRSRLQAELEEYAKTMG